jgi:hypothetical protein
MYGLNFATLCWFTAVWNRSFGAQTRVHLPLVTRKLQALDRVIHTIGELCARRLDRISRLNVRRQGDRGLLGLHSAKVGKYIDVSILLLPKSVVATRVRRWCTGEAACCATIREGVELVTVSFSLVWGVSHCSRLYLAGPRFGSTKDAPGSYVSIGRDIYS